jgi:DUF1680 family protein
VIGLLCAAALLVQHGLEPVPFDRVRFEEGFWGPRLETNRRVTIPYASAQCVETGRLANFASAGGLLPGAHRGQRYDDSDVYKVIEGASYALASAPDPDLEAQLDEWIRWIAAAQEDDGYLYTPRTIDPAHPPAGAGAERWSLLVESHELYCLGHLFEAAVAHHAATGKDSLLQVAVKAADLLLATFGPGQRVAWPGHQEVEIGLVRLARATGRAEYAALAEFFLAVRGTPAAAPPGSTEAGLRYLQAHAPPLEQREAVGHAVRAGYMSAAMADVAATSGDVRWLDASARLWEDVAGRKTYLTGGIGARAQGEAFGDAYELPNAAAYAETCAAVAYALWSQRLFLTTGTARYAHLLERIMMNGFLAGVSASGDRFFYPNPLARRDGPVDPAGDGGRAPWFTTSCCPVNVVRVVPSVPGMQWAVTDDVAVAVLLQSGRARLRVAGRELVLRMETGWPWAGKVRVVVEEVEEGIALPFTLRVRVPNGARAEPMPGGLYAYLGATDGALGEEWVEERIAWSAGSSAEWEFPLPVRRVIARDEVAACRGRVAIERGPLVYCIEGVDHDGRVEDLWLPDDTVLTPRWEPDLLGGVTVLEGVGRRASRGADGALVSADAPIRMIPYYAWANRGPGGMAVWLPRRPDGVRLPPEPTLATGARASASHHFELDTLVALNDGLHPEASGDHAIPRHTFWPHVGGEEWLRYDFAAPTTIAAVRVYWFDDTGVGRCRVPGRAQVEWLDASGAWQPVNAIVPLGVAKDAWNEQSFAPVATTALRLRIRLQSDGSAGVLEWEVR